MSTADIVTEQIFFTSKDGTKVPMFLTYKKGIKKMAVTLCYYTVMAVLIYL